MSNQNYAQYTLTDFLEDDSFIQWVINGDAKSNVFWQSFLISYPEKDKVVQEAASIIRVYRKQVIFTNDDHREKVWNRIDASIPKRTVSPTKTFRLPLYFKVAASIAILIACSVMLWTLKNNHTTVVTTSYGEVKAVTLPDQSIVMLNGNSTLTYEDSWDNRAAREVWIKGEAYFDIRHLNQDTAFVMPSERFIVHGNGIDIRVLGTSFNVKSRRNKTNIALLSGKIEVSYADSASVPSGGLVMMPGDYVEYSGQKLLIKKKLLRPHKAATWTVREITFTDPSLNDIMETLQDNYGYAINVEDKDMMDMKIEGEISVTSIQELLSLVSTTLSIRVEESGKEIIITRK
ncbi:FecR domain-containing protein [Chryseolinea sp. H1M3-3]|uniref:FecR family protein n=1 Tax=Chryseolinea sp. H1M3-3 TaxID=3034144 RepID=UPI0023EDB943|nr:FecR domain-containing protein [Chryseolinea sp. H1M3-3]